MNNLNDKKSYICDSTSKLTKDQLVTCGRMIIAEHGEKMIKPYGGGKMVNLDACREDLIEKLYTYVYSILQ